MEGKFDGMHMIHPDNKHDEWSEEKENGSCTFHKISLPYCDWGTKDEYSKCSQSQHIICAMVSLYSMFFFPKTIFLKF